MPVYPIVVFYDQYPAAEQPHTFRVGFPDLTVFEFNYRVLQLNKLNWRDSVRHSNPVATALMARMKIAPKDRPFVKLECLRLLTTLRLDPARTHLIAAFVDTYLTLNEAEKAVFQSAFAELEPERQEEIMELTTSWMRDGIQIGEARGEARGIQIGEARGEAQGQRKEALNMVTRLLRRRFGAALVGQEQMLEDLSLTQLEDLGEALLDFRDTGDLAQWLTRQN